MKKRLLTTGILACMLVFGTRMAHAQTVTLDTAIKNAGDELSYSLKKGSKVAVLAIRSDSTKMSNYIIEGLTSVLVNQRIVTVVDSVQIGQLQKEMNFQISGEVSDASAQAIGRKLGAQSAIIGSFEQFGNDYRLRLRVIEVETTVITHPVNVKNDAVVASLMSGGGGEAASTPVASASKPVTSTPPTATPPAAAAPQKEQESYEDFTGGQRFGTWALNAFVIPGLGSYAVMKDKKGGGTQLLLWGLSDIFYLIGALTVYDVVGDPNNKDRSMDEMDRMLSAGITCLAIGGILWAVNGIYNIARSATYHKPQPQIASLIDPNAWNIAILPGKNGIERVSLSYTMRF